MPNIITSSNTTLSRKTIKRKIEKQQLSRLFRGAYIDTAEYVALDPAGQYRARAQAFLATHPKLKAWGITAAALMGAPVLAGAPLHFSGARGFARSKQKGCVFHEALAGVPEVNNRTAQILFECVVASPLPDALIAANYLLSSFTKNGKNSLLAWRDIDGQTREAFLRRPLDTKTNLVKANITPDVRQLDPLRPDFLRAYSAARITQFASPAAELVWLDFAQFCCAFGSKRAIRKALGAGLYFSDQMDSPAESLLIARCVELGFCLPHLQVNITDPTNDHFLGRVDGLWPSAAVLKGLRQQDDKFGRVLYSKQFGDFDSVIVEFDGRQKYQENYAATLEQERQRQNAINNLGFRFVRINWDDLMRPEVLRKIFQAAKVPRAKRE